MSEPSFTREQILQYLNELARQLAGRGTTGEIVLTGGAVMLLVLRNRDVTKDIDAYFSEPTDVLRDSIQKIAQQYGLRADWLNDGVKGFFYGTPPQIPILELPGLRVYAVTPAYLLVMKVMAGRPEDIADARALIKHLNLKRASDVLLLVDQYVPDRLITARVRYFTEDLFDEKAP